jgi:hypothetical protein
MHKNATKCNKTQSKWCINKHGSSKIRDTFETYHTSSIDGTTAPNGATALRESIKACPPPRPRCAMPLRLIIIDMEDAHHYTSCLHHPAVAPKTMPPRRSATPKRATIIHSGPPNLGFPPEQLDGVSDDCIGDAFSKVTMQGHRHCRP